MKYRDYTRYIMYSKPFIVTAVKIDPGVVFPCLHNRRIICDRAIRKMVEGIINASNWGGGGGQPKNNPLQKPKASAMDQFVNQIYN
jgi:hypothetical protein